MLVIISGTDSVNKNYIAKKVFCKMNPVFKLKNDHTVKFNVEFADSEENNSYISAPYEIYNEKNEVVYDTKNRHLDSLIADEVGLSIFKEADDLYDKFFVDPNLGANYDTMFVDVEYDLEIDTNGFFWDEMPQYHSFPHGYQDFVDRYKNREVEHFVVHGSFSKAFIDLIRKDIGFDNVKVYNIIRHPIVATYLNEKKPNYYEKNPTMTKERNISRVAKSVVNSFILSQFSDITSIKFEDIMKDGFVNIEGHRIDLPEYTDYNGLISTWEKDNITFDHVDEDAVQLTCFLYSNTNEVVEKEYKKPVPKMPTSVLATLGYENITREQIVAPKE